MFSRRKNLLEAFQNASNSASTQAPARPAADSLLRGGAGPASPARLVGRGFRAPMALGVIVLGLTFTVGFLTGRSSAGREARAEAARPSSEAPPERSLPASQPRTFQKPPAASPEPATSEGSSAEGQRIEESALFDPANRSTVVVASYSNSKASQELAWATYQHLRAANLPAFPPVESRHLFVVLVGAAPSEDALKPIEAAVKALSRDGKRKDYPDAYCARIDTLIPRPTKGPSKP